MGIKLNPFTGLFDLTGNSGQSIYFGDPVATEGALPTPGNSGEVRVVRATNHIYVYDQVSGTWIDSGLTPAVVGNTPNVDGYLINPVVGGNVTHQQLILEPANATNPGVLTAVSQSIGGNKTFNGSILFNPDGTQTIGLNGTARPASIYSATDVTAGSSINYAKTFLGSTPGLQLTYTANTYQLLYDGTTLSEVDNHGHTLTNKIIGRATWYDSSNVPMVIFDQTNGIQSAKLSSHFRALQSDGSGYITESAVTSTELGYVSGVTSAIQTQLDSKIPLTQKAAANGVATLDSGGKIPLGQLPASLMEYQGTYNASTNTPTLVDGTGVSGYFYRVQVAGTQNFGSGSQTFVVGDWVMYNGSIWQLAHSGADAVTSVNGLAGAVTLTTTNINEGTNLYFTNGRAQAAITGAASTVTTTNLNNSVAVVSDGSGKIASSATTATEIGFVSGVTSSIQTQLNSKPNKSAGDLNEASFVIANNQSSAANITGLAFANATVRSFEALVSVEITATSSLFSTVKLFGTQKSATWDLGYSFVGDDSQVVFSINSSGQVQYQTPSYAGYTLGKIKSRAITTTVG